MTPRDSIFTWSDLHHGLIVRPNIQWEQYPTDTDFYHRLSESETLQVVKPTQTVKLLGDQISGIHPVEKEYRRRATMGNVAKQQFWSNALAHIGAKGGSF